MKINKFFFKFHISRKARQLYELDKDLSGRGDEAESASFQAAQRLARKINEKRRASVHPERAVRAGQINAIGLIVEILHFIVGRYRELKNPRVLPGASEYLREKIGRESLDKTLLTFVERFPSSTVYQGRPTPDRYFTGTTRGVPNRQILCAEIMILYISSRNPAFGPLAELFDDRELTKATVYRELIRGLRAFFKKQPRFGPENLPLIDLLMAPIRAAPDSLSGQLAYIREKWGALLSSDIRRRLLVGVDIIKEEEKRRGGGGEPIPALDSNGQPAPAELGSEYIPDYNADYERFSPDLDWMPRVVLMVKNIYVWLDQLSKRYRRGIKRLDQIPDEELDVLSRWGFTSLWLIGLWERSSASRKIKRGCGNQEAGASAYSLYDYVIARSLGGEEALSNLKARALRRGIRLSSDMVPNHTGIYSKWVIAHPQWFIKTSSSPFPTYRFTGQNLSDDHRVEIFIEDGYWDRRDAAVVFKRVDRQTEEVRYIYHGNDGTNMPWNDTAQLDFLQPQVREAVIQTILHVARMFPIIRFDAAMVLTRGHFERLWYPPPGSGGDIPSRAGQGIPTKEFNRLFPKEFWREVVDRVASEVPDTLLLAEAFWMLENYFVRTLGMHRVYNSAFMSMLKMEMNAEYRRLLKNILEFDLRILKRFVNFMSNPDEAPAVAQFGRGDKYFGICTLMVTMPGLPLFGHGQVEGFSEKYGMEYSRAYWNEPVDGVLVKRHEQEIFPLMKKRRLFSDVTHFYLYDFFTGQGQVNEDVLAYSNRYENERALVVYHNRCCDTAGWIRLSAARTEKSKRGREIKIRVDLARGLGLRAEDNDYCIFRDQRKGLEYVRSSRELREKGLYIELGAYGVHVFTDFREIKDDQKGFLARLEEELGGKGTRDVHAALKKVYFASLHRAFREVVNPGVARQIFRLPGKCSSLMEFDRRLDELLRHRLNKLFREVSRLSGIPAARFAGERQLRTTLKAIALLVRSGRLPSWQSTIYSRPALTYLLSRVPATVDRELSFFRIAFVWSIFRHLHQALNSGKRDLDISTWLNKWFLGELTVEFIQGLECDWNIARQELSLISILVRYGFLIKRIKTKKHLYLMGPIFQDSEVRRYLRFNWYSDTLWFYRESFEELLYWLSSTSIIDKAVDIWTAGMGPRARGLVISRAVHRLMEQAAASGYRVKEFRASLDRKPAGRGRIDIGPSSPLPTKPPSKPEK